MKRPRTIVSRKTLSSSAAAQFFASIDDLLIQVFLRLPVKQLCRFKLVSKHWNSIISDPTRFLRKPVPAVGLIFQYRYKGFPNLDNPLKSKIVCFNQPAIPKPMGEPFGRGAKVLQSCNGLLLCKSDYQDRYIYNPMTKKSSTLYDPGTGKEYFSLSILGMYLAFDPSQSCHYKLVCVVKLKDHDPFGNGRFKFEVYSSETASWRRCGEPFSATVDFESGGVYWKGAIHWVSLTKAGKSIYFNPCDENDRMLPTVMPSPPILEDVKRREYQYWEKQLPLYDGRNYHFGESCGHLNFMDAYSELFEFNVYEMKTDYSEWFVKYRVDLSNVLASDLFSVCALVRGNKDEDSFLVLRVGDKFMRCNLVDKSCETILEFEQQEEHEEFPHQYTEGAFGNIDGVWVTETETRSHLWVRSWFLGT